ncbi:MAG: hypothetical protein PHE27_03590 [Alphaproteobacteria bacterium]|nr:hypothetical protein [Alphaproteobacteria bacterium]
MEELTLGDCIAIFRRWKKIFFLSAALLLALSLVFVSRWSNYRSTATIQIEQPEVTPAAQRDKTSSAERRISEIQQKVLSTGTLAEIITKFNLYPASRKSLPIAAIASGMRKKIKLDFVAASGKEGMIAFRVSFDYHEPLRSQQVTDELVSRFLDEDLKARRSEAQQTSAFFGTQIEVLEASLTEQEKKIAEYHEKNGLSRPENFAYNQQIASSLSQNLQGIDNQLTATTGSLSALRAQLVATDPYSRVSVDGQSLTTPTTELKALKSHYAAMTSQYGPEHPDVIKVRNQIAALQAQVRKRDVKSSASLKAQIDDVRTKLETSQKEYGPEHPDVVALKNKLGTLEGKLSAQAPGTDGDGIIEDADNPAYLQLVAQFHILEEQRKSLTAQRADIQTQLDNYQKVLVQNPQAERELAALTRDYENAQIRYREIKEKKMIADMHTQVEQDRKGERLSLVNPPELPMDTQPRRKLLLLASLVASIFCGLAAVVAAQLLSGAIVGPRMLGHAIGALPLVEIPHIYTKEEIKNSAYFRMKRAGLNLFSVYGSRVLDRVDPDREYVGKCKKAAATFADFFKKNMQP